MNRKKYLIIIALVIFVFLAVFTFANPLNNDEEVNDKEVSEEKEEVTDKEDEEEKEEEEAEEEEEQVVVPIYPIYNNHGVDINKKPQVVVDHSYEEALKAVEQSEKTFNSKDYDEASKLVELVKDETKKAELEERLSEVKEIIELTDFVDTLVKDVKQVSSKTDMDNIRKNIKESKIEERLSKISNELIKKLLIEKLETIADKIEDDKNPEINIEDGAILNSDTKITVTDDSEVTIKLNNEEIENNTVVTDGKYTLVATDASFNTTTISFAIDTVDPVGAIAYSTTNPTKDDVVATITTNEDIKDIVGWTKVNGKKFTKTYTVNTDENVTVYDLAGNEISISISINNMDKVAPVIVLPSQIGSNQNEMHINAGDTLKLNDLKATVTDNVDEDKVIEPYRVDLIVSDDTDENSYDYDFSKGFKTKLDGQYEVYYKTTDSVGNESTSKLLVVISREVIEISTGQELKDLFADASKLQNKRVVLTADLDMTGIDWKPVAGIVNFALDGNGHKISNLTYEPTGTNAALFIAHTGSASVEFYNLTVENATITSTTNYAAIFAADADTADLVKIKNCHIKNSRVQSNKYAAGFIGYTAGYDVQNNGPVYSDIIIKDSSMEDSTIIGGGSTASFVAHAGGNADTTVIIKDSTLKNNELDGEDLAHTGIIIGTVHVGKVTTVENVNQENNKVEGVLNPSKLFGRYVKGANSVFTYIADDAEELKNAINGSFDNEIIKVKNGTYDVGNLEIYNSIQLIGESEENTIIKVNAGGLESAAGIYVNDVVTLENLTVEQSNANYAAIKVTLNLPERIASTTLKNITTIGGYSGINIHGIINATIDNVNITSPVKIGLSIASSDVALTNSNIVSGAWGAIGIMYKADSSEYPAPSVATIGTGNQVTGYIYAEGIQNGNKYIVDTSEWEELAPGTEAYVQK